jgi:16S rRNA (uracil1498-N3)-methyltransferase
MGVRHFSIKGEGLREHPATLTLTGGEAHHMLRVLRLGRGSIVNLVDDTGTVARAKILWENGHSLGMELTAAGIRTEDRLPVELVVGLLKKSRMDWLIQKATELGAAAIRPVTTEHTVVRIRDDDSEQRRGRWREIARQALKQCRGHLAPTIHPLASLYDVLEDSSSHGAKLVLWEAESDTDLLSAWREQGNTVPLTIVVGPEGGFSMNEIVACERAGFHRASMGSRTLRAETAAIAALAALGAAMAAMAGEKTSD